jgi:hypothetical protein
MKLPFLSLSACCAVLLPACGSTVETTFRFSTRATVLQRERIARSVDATAVEFGLAAHSNTNGAMLIRDYSVRRPGIGILRLLEATENNSTYVLLYEVGRTKSAEFSAVETVLRNTFQRLDPGVTTQSRVVAIPF